MKRIMLVLTCMVLLAGTAYANFYDEFSSSTLDPGWRIQWEDPAHWSLTERPGFLRIKTLYTNYDTIWNSLYHTEGIAGNFEVSARLICWPDSEGQTAGIYADYDSNFHGVPRAVVGIVRYFDYGVMVFGITNDSNAVAGYSDTLVYLRIRTSGDTVFAEYSGNNTNWSAVCRDQGFAGHQVSGMIAFNDAASGGTPATPHMNADFDWFHLTALGAVDEQNGQTIESVRIAPNPFIGFSHAAGHELEYFTLYDVSGKKVGAFRGDRIGQGLAPGVYFVRGEDGASVTARIVKIR